MLPSLADLSKLNALGEPVLQKRIGIWSSGQPTATSTLLLVGRIFIHSVNYSCAQPLAHLFIIFMDQGLRAPQYWDTKTTMQTLPLLRGYMWVPCSLESLVCLHGRHLPPAPCMGKVGVCLSCVSGLWAPLGETHGPIHHRILTTHHCPWHIGGTR